MTGQEFKLTYMSMGLSGRDTAKLLGITSPTITALTKSEKVDKRTELAILYLKQQYDANFNKAMDSVEMTDEKFPNVLKRLND